MILTNEGNGDLTSTLPRVHIVIASIEKVVPTLEDASTILRLLARSATGQEMATYTSFATGPRRDDDPDGPSAYHVVLLDNGRSEMLGSVFQDMLRCIRCGACLNHCPVYGAIGGHAYGSVYPGPMGAVLTPALQGIEHARDLPNASSFCGRCEEVCPMSIPLPKMMRAWRERDFAKGSPPLRERIVAQGVGVRCEESAAVSCALGCDRAVPRVARRKKRSLLAIAVRQILDADARLSGATGQNLSSALRQGQTGHAVMSSPEDANIGNARGRIFARIRAALDVDPEDKSGHAVVADRLRRHPSGTIPARARCHGEQAIAQFSASMRSSRAPI